MYNEPILLFLAVVNLPLSLEEIENFKKLFLGLLGLEIFIGLLQLPIYFSTHDSESIIGTFQHNAEQYSAFIFLSVFYLIGRNRVMHGNKLMYNILAITVFVLILLNDNKASWAGVCVSLFYVFWSISKLNSEISHKFKFLFIFFVLIILGVIVALNSSKSINKFNRIKEAYDTGNLFNLGKLKSYKDVFQSMNENPHMAIFGSGPGTFYSRSSYQFYYLSDDMLFPSSFENKIVEEFKIRESNSMGGVINKLNVEPYFKKFYKGSKEKIYQIGSGQVDDPYSSYSALLGEVGTFGVIIYMTIYYNVLKLINNFRKKYEYDEFIFPLIITCSGFIVYTLTVSFYNNWMETGRMMTILWCLIAIVFKYDQLQVTATGLEAQ